MRGREKPMLIMLCIHLTTIILFCGQASHIYCLTPTNMEIRESYLILNSDGTLKYTSKVPDCGSGGKIFLISYSYQQIQCDNECYSVHEESLLSNDIILLHEMCSMREKCQNLTFGVRTEGQRNRINSVKIAFRCLDHTSTSIDICKPCTVLFNDTLYLTTSGDSARLYRMCECFVDLDSFLIKAEDIRLNSIQEKKCTNAVVHINNKAFKCDAERGSFDAVFKRTVAVSISNAFISVIPKSATDLPSMVLITVSPKRTSRIICIPKSLRSGAVTLSFGRTTKSAVTVEEVPYTNSIRHKDTERSSSTANSGHPFLPAFIVTMVCAFTGSLLVTTYVICRCLQSKEYNIPKKNKIQSSVTLKSVSSYSGEGSQYNSTDQDHTSEDNDKRDSSSSPVFQKRFTSVGHGPSYCQTSDILHIPVVICHTTLVSEATLEEVPPEAQMTEEESKYDNDTGEETSILCTCTMKPTSSS